MATAPNDEVSHLRLPPNSRHHQPREAGNTAGTGDEKSVLSELLVQAFSLMMLLGPDPNPETVHMLAARATRLVNEIVRAPAQHDLELVEERLYRAGILQEILAGSPWFTANQIKELQEEPPSEKGQPVKEWKSEGRIFGVRYLGAEYFPAYQFDGSHQPLPVIREILEALRPVTDPWVLAAWFCYPNGWITGPSDDGKRSEPIAPMHALDMREAVLSAAAIRRSASAA